MNRKFIKESLIGSLLGACFTLAAYQFIDQDTLSKIFASDNPLVILISVVLAVFLAIAIHEFGHIFFGIIQGFKVELFVVGFFGIIRKDGKLKFFLNKDLQYFGGVAATSPTKKHKDIRKNFAWIVAGGPLFSLLLGLGLILTFTLQDNYLLNAFLVFTGFISLALFLATTLPEKSGSFFTDRKRLQRLLDKGQDGKVELALLESINQNFVDGHCQNIRSENLAIIKTAKEPFIQFWGYYFELQQQKDKGIESPDESILTKLKSYEKDFPKAAWKSFGIE